MYSDICVQQITQLIVVYIVVILGAEQTIDIYVTVTEEALLCYRMLRNMSTRSVSCESLTQEVQRTKLLVRRRFTVLKILHNVITIIKVIHDFCLFLMTWPTVQLCQLLGFVLIFNCLQFSFHQPFHILLFPQQKQNLHVNV